MALRMVVIVKEMLERDCLTPKVLKALERSESRNYDDGSFYRELCDRYDVSYHTDKAKVIHLAINELCTE